MPQNKQSWQRYEEYVGGVVRSGRGIQLEEAIITAKMSSLADKIATGGSTSEVSGGLVTPGRLQLTELREIVANNAAKVERSPNAVRILARLYEKRILRESDMGDDCTWADRLALAQLAGAHLCDVDKFAVRVTDAGIDFVEEIRSFADV